MVRKIENVALISFLAALLLVVQSSTSSPIQNDLLEELKVELRSLRVKVDLLEARNVENEAIILKQERKITELEEKMEAKLRSDHLAPAFFSDKRVLHSPENDKSGKENEIINSIKFDSDNSLGALNDNSRKNSRPIDGFSTRAVAPSSCRELSLIGHSLDGLYLVKNPATNKIETLLCNFGTSISEQFIGDVDVQTRTVHFYAQRSSTFSTPDAVIRWETAPLNEGGAMDLASGLFTAPVPGIYHFEFSGVKSNTSPAVAVHLRLNGVTIGYTFANNLGDATTYDGISFSASLQLKANDRVSLFNSGDGIITGFPTHCTHFTGWLVEEDLV